MNYRERYKKIRQRRKNAPELHVLMVHLARTKATLTIESVFPSPIPGGLLLNEILPFLPKQT